MSSPDPHTMAVLGEVKGQLSGIAVLIKETNDSTNRRLDDLKKSVDDRLKTHEERIGRLESNERGTAIKAAALGATSGAAAGLVGQFLGMLVKIKIGG